MADTTTESKPGGGSRPRRRKWVWIVGGVVVFLILMVLLAPTIASTGMVRSMVLSSVNGKIKGGSVEIADWSMGWTTGIRLTGVKVLDAQGKTVLEMPELDTGLTVMDVVRGDFSLGKVLIHGVVFHIVKHADGTTNLPSSANPSSSSSTTIPKLSAELDVADCHGDIVDEGANRQITVPSIAGDLSVNVDASGQSTAGGTLTVANTAISVNGDNATIPSIVLGLENIAVGDTTSQGTVSLTADPILKLTMDVTTPRDALEKSIDLVSAAMDAVAAGVASAQTLPAPGGTGRVTLGVTVSGQDLLAKLPHSDFQVGTLVSNVVLKSEADKAQVLIDVMLDNAAQEGDTPMTIRGLSVKYALNVAGGAAVDPRGNGTVAIDEVALPAYGLTVDHFVFAPHLIDFSIVDEIPGKPAGQNWPTPATCNGGTIDLGGATVKFPNWQPTLTLPAGKHLLGAISLNPLLAKKLAPWLGPLFADPSQANGSLDLVANQCNSLPLQEAMLESTDASNDGVADFTLNITGLQVAGGPILSSLATVGLPTLGGEVRNAKIHVEHGVATVDIAVSVGGKMQSVGFRGGIRTADKLLVPGFVLVLKQPNGTEIDVPITGTVMSPQLDIGAAVQQQLLKGGAGGLLKNLLPGGK